MLIPILILLAARQDDGPILPKDTLPAELAIGVYPDGLPEMAAPPDNELTPARVALGRKLFFDPILSEDGKVSCASCHQPEHGFADPRPVSLGIRSQAGTRNAPSLLNRAYGTSFFWDGRAGSLEEQALKPIEHAKELGSSVPKALKRIQDHSEYPALFKDAYGEVSAESLARSLASFQRVLLSGDSPVDRFQSSDYASLSDEGRKGLWIFESKGRCWKCHSGPNYTDESFRNTGVSWNSSKPDRGRHEVTKKESDLGAFKTPSLRHVGQTAPYMHDGSLKTLEDVVEFYNKGGTRNPHLDSDMKPLNLSADEQRFLVEFLKALEGQPVGKAKSTP